VNKESCECRRVACFEEVKQVGDFCWHRVMPDGGFTDDPAVPIGHLCIWLPGASRPTDWPVQLGAASSDKYGPWGWDGNLDKPTLYPSMHHIDNWHGHLQAGRLNSCP